MKIFVGLLVAACAFQAVFALPAGSPQDDVEIVRPTGEAASTDDFNDFKGVISTGTDDGYPFFQRSPQSFAFNLGFFDAFEDILRRLQARIYPQSVDSSSSDESSSSVLGRFDFDEGKANKTSTVRVENNLKVVVNDTFYDGDTGLFRVRTVNIRPLDSGEEVVEGTFHHDGSFVPATEGPKQAGVATKDREDADSDEDDGKREPLAKDETENEIRRNADQPESSTTPREPAAQSFLANTDDDGASDLNAAFVTDNTQGNNSNNNNNNNDEQEPIVSESSRTETNKPANDENSNSASVESVEVHDNQAKKMEENYQDDSVDAVVGGIDEEPNHYGSEALSNLESGRLTIENNEETEQQQQNDDNNENDEHDKLNESSSAATKATTDDAEAETEVIGEVVNAETNDEQDEQDDAEDAEDTQSNSSGSSEFAAYEKAAEAVLAAEAEEEFEAEAAHAAFEMAKEREDLASSSSDDEDGNFEMNPTFNAEWSEFAAAAAADNDKSATNDISNDIDVYDAVPIDLSNDIAVNNWAAAQGNAYPYNPDAEIISDAADRIPTAYNAIPRFERLTINTHHMK